MCLIVFAYKTHPKYKFILAANRDEFYERPTTSADWWEDHPEILAGRDLKAKGTWMAINKEGRFATVTNFRDIKNIRDDARSRGDLPVDFLKTGQSPEEYANLVFKEGNQYNGFNLLALDEELIHVSNYGDKVTILDAGVYGLSNALLDTPWPKVQKSKDLFQSKIKEDFHLEELIQLMQDDQVAPDEDLPPTGLSLEMERAVSAMCIKTDNYGTCCSTAITIDYDGNVHFMEKSYPVGDRKDETKSYAFKIQP